MNKERLKQIDYLINKQIENGEIAGASIKVFKDNIECFKNNYGFSNLEKNIKTDDNTIYRLYSMTKPVTAVAVMILFERGLIDLYNPVCWYLEGFKNQIVLRNDGTVEDVNREVRIIDLLNMTAGVVYPDASFRAGEEMEKLQHDYYERLYNENKGTKTVDLCNMIGEKPLEFQPGESWRYGFCADILGGIVEVVSGMKYSEFLKKEIINPLNMIDTDFYVPEEKQDRFAELYDYNWETKELFPCTWRHLCLTKCLTPPDFESGGAGLVSTVEDYSHFVLMLVNGGVYNGARILGEKTIKFMAQNALTDEQLKAYNWDSLYGYGYGFLMRVMMDTAKAGSNGSVGEFGWDGWLGTYMMIDREENLAMVYAIQKCGGNGVQNIRALRQIVYSAID